MLVQRSSEHGLRVCAVVEQRLDQRFQLVGLTLGVIRFGVRINGLGVFLYTVVVGLVELLAVEVNLSVDLVRHVRGYDVDRRLVIAGRCIGCEGFEVNFFMIVAVIPSELHDSGLSVRKVSRRGIDVEVHADVAAEGNGVLREEVFGNFSIQIISCVDCGCACKCSAGSSEHREKSILRCCCYVSNGRHSVRNTVFSSLRF